MIQNLFKLCHIATAIGTASIFFISAPAYAAKAASQHNHSTKKVIQKIMVGVSLSALRVDAPREYTIQASDDLDTVRRLFLKSDKTPTHLLWGISSKDAKRIRLIALQPGQTWYLVRGKNRAYLTQNPFNNHKNSTVHLNPQIRMSSIEPLAHYQIPKGILNSFITQTRIIDAQELAKSPRIIAGENKAAQFFGATDSIYAQNAEKTPIPVMNLQSFRVLNPVYDPANSNTLDASGKPKPVAYEAQHTGNLNFMSQHNQGVTRFSIQQSTQEVGVGDYLIPAQKFDGQLILNAPKQSVEANIIKLYNGQNYGAKGDIILINKGSQHGIQAGHVLYIKSKPRLVPSNPDEIKRLQSSQSLFSTPPAMTQLPRINKGHVVIFQVSPLVSYAYVNNSTDTVETSDELSDKE